MHDLRYVLRTLPASPGFALTAIVTLGIGLGLNTAFFTVFDAFAWRTPAVRDAANLHHVTLLDRNGKKVYTRYSDYLDLSAETDVLAQTAAQWRVTGYSGNS